MSEKSMCSTIAENIRKSSTIEKCKSWESLTATMYKHNQISASDLQRLDEILFRRLVALDAFDSGVTLL